MKSSATKTVQAKPPKPATASLRPKSDVWIQHELDIATANAQKNRSIRDGVVRATRPNSAGRKSVWTSAQVTHRTDLPISPRADSITTVQKSSIKFQETSIQNQGLPPMPSSNRVEGHSSEMSSLQTQFHSMIGEWSFVIKQAIFHDDVNEVRRHTPQLLILL